ncbi:nanoRNase/pAp phosphatase, hydrolyzes c-di-AMP and oligoRNAs [Desulfacinum hydrothermale DSM 13146]|uniref:NanoRNase/pAp phosphatase, hydrolyzes c-di-AMP and oligoRNAs n=1 Tax=Desulfacinum hydrothermale DSM 13146 TaxID=1121390 RepID=A0A1W1WYG1_9BACT|nr:CBS domain-containing protein [Desulfacinum hydrothermale]SMC16759.1 nanoRNase/pAp phosphatase, hydrolyzes c-di-AMP and oligoRNAs [Desulfacinum hydrothermale DSM 13146]
MEIITTHKNVDFDALASVVAAQKLYPQARIVLPRSVNANVKAFLSIHKDLFQVLSPLEVPLDAVKRLIVVDAKRWDRLDCLDSLRQRRDLEIHVWDHHPGETDLEAQEFRWNDTGAAVTLLVEELEQGGVDLDPVQATLFLAGIHEDTGHLTFPCTRARDARAAAFLLEKKADLHVIQTALRPGYGPQHRAILTRLLETVVRDKISGYTVAFARADVKGYVPDLAAVVTMLRDVLNCDAVFALFWDERRNQTIVIGRSDADTLDLAQVLRTMGGGGRPEAASAVVKAAKPAGVETWLREILNQNGNGYVKIFDLMSFPVFTVAPEEIAEDVHEKLRRRGHTGAPVVEGERLVGIISVRDLVKLTRPSQLKAPVKAYMRRSVRTIGPQCTVTEALRIMVKHDIGRLPVLEDGRLVGIVTRSDLMLYYYQLI